MATIQPVRSPRKGPLLKAATPEPPRTKPPVKPTATIITRKKRCPPKQRMIPMTRVSRPMKVPCIGSPRRIVSAAGAADQTGRRTDRGGDLRIVGRGREAFHPVLREDRAAELQQPPPE